MPLAPKLAATALVTATVATLSVLSTPAYADDYDSRDDGRSNVQELVADVSSTVFACHHIVVDPTVPGIPSAGTDVCIKKPIGE